MANDADRSQLSQDLAIVLAVRQARKAAELPKSAGRCLYCHSPIADESRFCDADCRDDYERLQLRSRHG